MEDYRKTGAVRIETDPERGLSAEQVRQRTEDGLVNKSVDVKSKSFGRILKDNFLTLFNIMNYVLAALVIAVGSYKNALFIMIIVANILIGTIQEIRAKKAMDSLKVLTPDKARVIRDGQEADIHIEDVVLDDVIALRLGDQICADAIVLTGGIEVDESLLTGEADPISKAPGDVLYSGSFVIAGSCRARADKVGADSFAAHITGEAKEYRGGQSEIMTALKKIIKIVSVVIVPAGLLLFLKQYFLLHSTIEMAVVNAVAAMIGMIPEGLILLSSVVMALGVVRLSRHKTLVQELYCIEALARVDVLCLDKTGTITKGKMQVREVVPYEGGDPEKALSVIAAALDDCNPTMTAVRNFVGDCAAIEAEQKVPFSSVRKWSGVTIGGRSYMMGAAEYLLPRYAEELKDKIEILSKDGSRVVVVAESGRPLQGENAPEDTYPIGLVVIRDTIREEAPRTLKFFREQDVKVKVISGDDPRTVSAIAQEAGLEDGDKYVDAHGVTDEELDSCAWETGVFGRVTPSAKRELIRALKRGGHTVAMMGDGVNDVLALKEADCSISVSGGSDAARNVSQMVLLDDNFFSMYNVVMEGRRAINNIERSASLFLVKTIFSFLLAVLFLFVPWSYPFMPIQLTLISTLTIGAPSFALALERNKDRIKGDFLFNILKRAVPGALTTVADICIIMITAMFLPFSQAEISTMALILTACSGFCVLFHVSWPLNLYRGTLLALLIAAFVCALVWFGPFFSISAISTPMWIVMAAVAVTIPLQMALYKKIVTAFEKKHAHLKMML